jgi:hypothetical protein
MALYPDDFPEEQPPILEHISDCSVCRKELKMLQSLQDAIREHRHQLVDGVSDCPSPSEITEFSLGKSPDPSIQQHVESCLRCTEEVELVKELCGEELEMDQVSSPSAEEKLIIRNAVVKEYGNMQSKPSFSVSAWLRSFFSVLHVPSMALGAVAAALLVAILVPSSPREAPFHLVLSDETWESAPEAMTKGGEALTHPKKVVPVILVQDNAGLSAKEAEDIYSKLDLVSRFGDQYEFLSPVDVKKALSVSSEKALDVSDAARLVFEKTDADYVLVFSVRAEDSRVNLAGSLVQPSGRKSIGSLSWNGIRKESLPDRISRVAADLLAEVEAE